MRSMKHEWGCEQCAPPRPKAAYAFACECTPGQVLRPSRHFTMVYTTADAIPLAEVDEAFGQLSGPATMRI